ncbi:hypothetical protein K443DRAFT_125294 [Laccaria amethystina LaAM-08-1]|uniref:Uncharacterized protein n=1 Tax=Laccaria amethystina LaAM-08-1 TaxID=1095629 RepID=A0A0C9WRW6_9AGAR|nr:hypothetical protein K443DRAFT_125294 [Laccaria amethystina LaAM-08-1]
MTIRQDRKLTEVPCANARAASADVGSCEPTDNTVLHLQQQRLLHQHRFEYTCTNDDLFLPMKLFGDSAPPSYVPPFLASLLLLPLPRFLAVPVAAPTQDTAPYPFPTPVAPPPPWVTAPDPNLVPSQALPLVVPTRLVWFRKFRAMSVRTFSSENSPEKRTVQIGGQYSIFRTNCNAIFTAWLSKAA